MRNPRASTALALVLALAPASAMAAAEWTYSDIDADGNLELTDREFEPVSRGVFAAWDDNRDERMTTGEFHDGLFTAWDADDDMNLTEQEYTEGFAAWFGSDARPAFDEIAGDDDLIAEDEFAEGLEEADALADFEFGEEGLDAEAFDDALYGVYDRDADDIITTEEYGEFADTSLTGMDMTETTGSIDANAIETPEVVALPGWDTEALYTDGISVEYLLDEAELHGAEGEIGSVENVIFSPDGNVLSIIAQVGGFWDMFDTHVNIPWEEVQFAGGILTVPVSEENVEDYSVLKDDYLTAEEAAQDTEVVEDDLETGPRAFRATELIGDYARIREGENGFANYGYVNDIIIRDGQIAAVVVEPDAGYGVTGGYYAYPYRGYGYGPGSPYYDMPYDQAEVVEADEFEYDRLAYE
jgi:hypothetical protein